MFFTMWIVRGGYSQPGGGLGNMPIYRLTIADKPYYESTMKYVSRQKMWDVFSEPLKGSIVLHIKLVSASSPVSDYRWSTGFLRLLTYVLAPVLVWRDNEVVDQTCFIFSPNMWRVFLYAICAAFYNTVGSLLAEIWILVFL